MAALLRSPLHHRLHLVGNPQIDPHFEFAVAPWSLLIRPSGVPPPIRVLRVFPLRDMVKQLLVGQAATISGCGNMFHRQPPTAFYIAVRPALKIHHGRQIRRDCIRSPHLSMNDSMHRNSQYVDGHMKSSEAVLAIGEVVNKLSILPVLIGNQVPPHRLPRSINSRSFFSAGQLAHLVSSCSCSSTWGQ